MQNQGLGETEPDQAYKQGEGDEKDLAQVLFSLFLPTASSYFPCMEYSDYLLDCQREF